MRKIDQIYTHDRQGSDDGSGNERSSTNGCDERSDASGDDERNCASAAMREMIALLKGPPGWSVKGVPRECLSNQVCLKNSTVIFKVILFN